MANTRRATGARPAPAAKAEALGESIEFEFEGETYTIAPPPEWDLDATEAAEEGKSVTFVKALLGPEQWLRFRSKPRRNIDLDRLGDAMMAAAGLGN